MDEVQYCKKITKNGDKVKTKKAIQNASSA